MFYKKIMKTVLINPKTIFCPLLVPIEDGLSIVIEEYQFLSDCTR